MDKVKEAFNGAKGAQAPAGQPHNDDMGDKAFAAGLKKTGHGNMNRDTQEKITDGVRGAVEKVTGKPVNSKLSN